MSPQMAMAVATVQAALPAPLRLGEWRRAKIYSGTTPEMREVLDDRGERLCDLVIADECAAWTVVTEHWLGAQDFMRKLGDAIQRRATVDIAPSGVRVRGA